LLDFNNLQKDTNTKTNNYLQQIMMMMMMCGEN